MKILSGILCLALLGFTAVLADLPCDNGAISGILDGLEYNCYSTSNGYDWVNATLSQVVTKHYRKSVFEMFICDARLGRFFNQAQDMIIPVYYHRGSTVDAMIMGWVNSSCPDELSNTTYEMVDIQPNHYLFTLENLWSFSTYCRVDTLSYIDGGKWNVTEWSCVAPYVSTSQIARNNINELGRSLSGNGEMGIYTGIVAVEDSACYTGLICDGSPCTFNTEELTYEVFNGEELVECFYNKTCVEVATNGSLSTINSVKTVNLNLLANIAIKDDVMERTSDAMASLFNTTNSVLTNVTNKLNYGPYNCTNSGLCLVEKANYTAQLQRLIMPITLEHLNLVTSLGSINESINNLTYRIAGYRSEIDIQEAKLANLTETLNNCLESESERTVASIDLVISADEDSSDGLDFTLPTILIISLGSFATLLILIIASLAVLRAFRKGRASWTRSK